MPPHTFSAYQQINQLLYNELSWISSWAGPDTASFTSVNQIYPHGITRTLLWCRENIWIIHTTVEVVFGMDLIWLCYIYCRIFLTFSMDVLAIIVNLLYIQWIYGIYICYGTAYVKSFIHYLVMNPIWTCYNWCELTSELTMILL